MIVIVDFGSQTAHLIERRLKKYALPTQLITPAQLMQTIDEAAKAKKPVQGIILSGGPNSVYAHDAIDIDNALFELGIPILGICYGWQLMALKLGGKVVGECAEFGPEIINFRSNVFQLPFESFSVIMSHGDAVTQLPPSFETLASSQRVSHAVVADHSRRFFGLQYHPEISHTQYGDQLLYYFASTICQVTSQLHETNHITMIESIRAAVGSQNVLAAVSGGVDSTVAARLIDMAVGAQLYPVYIESGLMRPGTRELVQELFPKNIIIVEAKKRFLEALKGVVDPEEKRKRCGHLYIELFAEIALTLPNISFLAQGTIYSDHIESMGSEHASHIKSHHNVGGLPDAMPFALLEPLRYLYKDEVRELGARLGISERFLLQHPFPGPGYSVRIRGEVTEERLALLQKADAILLAEMEQAGLLHQLFQCFTVLTGAFSTAVKGDKRHFGEVLAIRAYSSQDVMSSEIAPLPYDLLKRIVSRIMGEVESLSRVVYDITPKPPATMEWE